MRGDNYKAWLIDIDSTVARLRCSKDLVSLLEFAILAPSSHNSQPWSFSIKKNELIIAIDQRRVLRVGDPDNIFANVSLGCTLITMLIVLDYAEIPFEYQIDTEKEQISLKLKFETYKADSNATSKKGHLIFEIPKRVTNRSIFDSTFLIPKNFKTLIHEQFRKYNIRSNLELFDDSNSVSFLGTFAIQTGIESMKSSSFRSELASHVKSNFTRSRVGMPAFGMEIPSLPSLLAPFFVRFFNMASLERRKDEAKLKSTQNFGLLWSKKDSFASYIYAGMAYQLIALLSARLSLTCPVIGSLTISPDSASTVSKHLNIQGNSLLVFRLGKPTTDVPHSPRLTVLDVVTDQL